MLLLTAHRIAAKVQFPVPAVCACKRRQLVWMQPAQLLLRCCGLVRVLHFLSAVDPVLPAAALIACRACAVRLYSLQPFRDILSAAPQRAADLQDSLVLQAYCEGSHCAWRGSVTSRH